MGLENSLFLILRRKIYHNKTYVYGEILKQLDRYSYFGTFIKFDGRCICEIRTKISMTKVDFSKMKNH